MALPAAVSLDKFLRVAVTAIQNNPKLLEADRGSLFTSVMATAQLGLLPDQQLGEAYFVPFKGKVQLVVGYRGLIKLARQGDIGHVEAEVICANDRVTFDLGDDSRFHIAVNWEDRGPMVAVYALAKFRDGGLAARVVMRKAEVDAIRQRSQAAAGPAWSENYEEMARKTALRRLSKYLPLTTEAQAAFRISELHEEMAKPVTLSEDGQVLTDAEVTEPAPEPRRRRRTALDAVVDAPTDPESNAPQPTVEPAADFPREWDQPE